MRGFLFDTLKIGDQINAFQERGQGRVWVGQGEGRGENVEAGDIIRIGLVRGKRPFPMNDVGNPNPALQGRTFFS